MMYNTDSKSVEFYCIKINETYPHYGIRFGGSYNYTATSVSYGKFTTMDSYGVMYNDQIMYGGCNSNVCGDCSAGSFSDVNSTGNNILIDFGKGPKFCF